MKKKILSLVIIFILLGGLFGYKLYSNYLTEQAQANYTPAPITVTAGKASTSDWQSYLTAVGTLQAYNGVNIAPQIAGVVETINFKSGQMVEKGQLIISLDANILKAQLKNAVAARDLAKTTYERYQKLLNQKAISQIDVATALSQLNQYSANVKAIRAQIGQMRITAPFSGRLGLRDINLGEYIAAGTLVTTLQTVNPMLVNFPIPAQQISALKIGEKIQVSIDSNKDKTYTGKITAINSAVDQTTRSIMVRATVDNSDQTLVPGMFANIKVLLPVKKDVVVVPADAVTYTLYGNSIYVLTDKKDNNEYTAKLTIVKTGETQNDKTEVLSGIKSGDIVVTNGQLKLQNNSTVKVVSDTKSTDSESDKTNSSSTTQTTKAQS